MKTLLIIAAILATAVLASQNGYKSSDSEIKEPYTQQIIGACTSKTTRTGEARKRRKVSSKKNDLGAFPENIPPSSVGAAGLGCALFFAIHYQLAAAGIICGMFTIALCHMISGLLQKKKSRKASALFRVLDWIILAADWAALFVILGILAFELRMCILFPQRRTIEVVSLVLLQGLTLCYGVKNYFMPDRKGKLSYTMAVLMGFSVVVLTFLLCNLLTTLIHFSGDLKAEFAARIRETSSGPSAGTSIVDRSQESTSVHYTTVLSILLQTVMVFYSQAATFARVRGRKEKVWGILLIAFSLLVMLVGVCCVSFFMNYPVRAEDMTEQKTIDALLSPPSKCDGMFSWSTTFSRCQQD